VLLAQGYGTAHTIVTDKYAAMGRGIIKKDILFLINVSLKL
jgi:hypothetical protein